MRRGNHGQVHRSVHLESVVSIRSHNTPLLFVTEGLNIIIIILLQELSFLLFRRTVWDEVLRMDRRLRSGVLLKNDEHKRVKVNGARCLGCLELYGVYRSTCDWDHFPAFRLPLVCLGVGTRAEFGQRKDEVALLYYKRV